jgi:murein DD-endopeptidase MepM/ murein hydrolase activator NlpD
MVPPGSARAGDGRERPPPRSHARGGRARHRKASPIAVSLQQAPGQFTVAVAGSALIVSAATGASVTYWPGTSLTHVTSSSQPAGRNQHEASSAASGGSASATGPSRRSGRDRLAAQARARARARALAAERRAAARAATARKIEQARLAAARRAAERRRQRHFQHAASLPPTTAAYTNPLRAVAGLIPERIDMGVDFGGAGPVYAIGDAVVTSAMAGSPGWPGGGWITYRLTGGPDAGKMIYLAEDVTPTVTAGQHVTAGTVIARMYNGGDGIETGWATPDGSTALSQTPEAGGISGGGPFPTAVGASFDGLLQRLGVPAAPNAGQPSYGTLPAGYPASR